MNAKRSLLVAVICASLGCAAQTTAPQARGNGTFERQEAKPGNICTDGDVRECQKVYAVHPGSTDCEISFQTCVLGKWSACGGPADDPTTEPTTTAMPAACEEAHATHASAYRATAPTSVAFANVFARLGARAPRFATDVSVHLGIGKLRLALASETSTFDDLHVIAAAPLTSIDATGILHVDEHEAHFPLRLGDVEIEATGLAVEARVDAECTTISEVRLTVFIPESAGRTFVAGHTLAALLGPLASPLGAQRGWRITLQSFAVSK